MAAKKPVKKSPAPAGAAYEIPFKDLAEAYSHQVENRRTAVTKGNGDALLAAIMDVVHGRIPFPEWLAVEVAAAIRRYTHHHVSTLDQAFGVKRPAGYRRKAVRERLEKAAIVIHAVHDLNRAGYPIDENMFEEVGKHVGVRKTTASKWYYLHKKQKTVIFMVSEKLNAKDTLPERLGSVAKALDTYKPLTKSVPHSKKKRGRNMES